MVSQLEQLSLRQHYHTSPTKHSLSRMFSHKLVIVL